SATTGHDGHDVLYVFTTRTPFDAERGYGKFAAYAVLEHGGDFKAAARALHDRGFGSTAAGPNAAEVGKATVLARVWPEPLAEEAFHGLAGEIVRVIAPHTEADPAALLINVLTAFGNVVGRGPHAVAEANRHGCNL